MMPQRPPDLAKLDNLSVKFNVNHEVNFITYIR